MSSSWVQNATTDMAKRKCRYGPVCVVCWHMFIFFLFSANITKKYIQHTVHAEVYTLIHFGNYTVNLLSSTRCFLHVFHSAWKPHVVFCVWFLFYQFVQTKIQQNTIISQYKLYIYKKPIIQHLVARVLKPSLGAVWCQETTAIKYQVCQNWQPKTNVSNISESPDVCLCCMLYFRVDQIMIERRILTSLG